MHPWVLFSVWSFAHVLHVVFGLAAFARGRALGAKPHRASAHLAGVAALFPLIGLAVFGIVFVFARASSEAQLNGDATRDAWGLWTSWWVILFLSSPVSFLIAIVAAAMPPYGRASWPSLASRLCALSAATLACYAVVAFAPTA